MKNCTDCKYAGWYRRSNGTLHPSGFGECQYPYKVPVLPKSMHWIGTEPTPDGGAISRGRDLEDHCVYWAK